MYIDMNIYIYRQELREGAAERVEAAASSACMRIWENIKQDSAKEGPEAAALNDSLRRTEAFEVVLKLLAEDPDLPHYKSVENTLISVGRSKSEKLTQKDDLQLAAVWSEAPSMAQRQRVRDAVLQWAGRSTLNDATIQAMLDGYANT